MDTIRETQVFSDNLYLLGAFAEYIVLGSHYT